MVSLHVQICGICHATGTHNGFKRVGRVAKCAFNNDVWQFSSRDILGPFVLVRCALIFSKALPVTSHNRFVTEKSYLVDNYS